MATLHVKSTNSKPWLEGAVVPDDKIEKDPVAAQYRDVFEGLGHLTSYQYKSSLKSGSKPYAVTTPRRIPQPYHQKVKEEINRIKTLGVLEEVTEPTEWTSPMVVVPKHNGDVRICVDYSHLNQSVNRKHYQLPTAEEIFAKLREVKYFTTLDASSRFWQVPLAKESSKLTTLLTPHGRVRFTPLRFGLNSRTEIFHKAMSTMLEGFDGAIRCVDDVLVWVSTKEEHDRRLHQVFNQFRQQGLRLNASKCKFRASQVKYFGHNITSDGVQPDATKLQSLLSIATPISREELRRFNGMAASLGKFVPNLLEVTGPLRDLLKKVLEWYWGPAQEAAFGRLKKLLASAPVLPFYSPTAPTIVSANASSYGTEAVSMQEQKEGRRAPIANASRTLTEAEKRYSQIDKEGLAITWACERFERYLLRRQKAFILKTDHKPLLPIMNAKDINQCPKRLQRLEIRLTRFHYHVQYVPGKDLTVADALSRCPMANTSNNMANDIETYISAGTLAGLPAPDALFANIRQATEKDPQL